MMNRKLIAAAGLASLAWIGAHASTPGEMQQPPATETTATSGDSIPDGGMPRYIRPETPEERMKRLGTNEDPGIDPDPERVWVRWGVRYRILRFLRRGAVYTDRPGYIQPHNNVNFTEELYQENEKYVWAWIAVEDPLPTKEELIAKAMADKFGPEQIAFLKSARTEFEPLEPPPSGKTIRFEEASEGLPTEGSWRNSLDVADMNGDGFADLVVPSQRGASSGAAFIFLGDGKGNWTNWNARWPVKLDYGSAVAGDFNRDKKMDVAFGVHLSGLVILLGDGKGSFRPVLEQKGFPTRRLVVADVDRDGWSDVVAISEGPVGRGADVRDKTFTNLRAWMNRGKGEKWEGLNLAGPNEVISGDWLAVGNFNGDRYPDFVGSNLYLGNAVTIYRSQGAGKYQPIIADGKVLPYMAVFDSVTAGPFSSAKLDDAIFATTRRWPVEMDPSVIPTPPLTEMVTIERVGFGGTAPERNTIARFALKQAVRDLTHADFDGDGNEDIAYSRYDPREAVLLLGDGKGDFARAAVEGLTLEPLRNYDLKIADVNRDRKPDVIVMYESAEGTAFSRKNGSIRVFLNRGVVAAK